MGTLTVASGEDWVKVYPTVANDQLYIDLKNLAENAEYTISDMAGKVVLKNQLSDLYNRINISALAAGNYVVKTKQGTEIKSIKITRN